MKQYDYYIYIMASKSGTLYIGVTNDLVRRVYEHKYNLIDGFTKKYNVNKLVYFEQTENVMSALNREKQLKNWHRDWKINLIKSVNPKWRDLSDEI